MTEILYDIKDSENMAHVWGDRFTGWYGRKDVKNSRVFLGAEIPVSDYNYRFIMPPKIEFSGGIISYTEAERLLGVFRFPQTSNGEFLSPVPIKDKNMEDWIKNLTDKEVGDLVNNNRVLVFEAFRIPQYGFEYFDLSDKGVFESICSCVGLEEATLFKFRVEKDLNRLYEEVKEKILSQPHILLILKNVLEGRLKNMKEVSLMTNGLLQM